jgi:ABC-type uncharacterized transport system substrate-binding protein
VRIPWLPLLCLLLLIPAAVAAGDYRIVVINSYHAEHPWVRAHNDALSARLAGRADLDIRYLDTKRTTPAQYAELAGRFLAEIIADPPGVVVLTDDNAVKLLGRPLMDRHIPVVFLGVNENPRKYLGEMEMATGVLERPLYKRSLLFLNEIMGPRLKHCLILFDSSATSEVIFDSVFRGHKRMILGNTGVELELIETFAQWKDRVLSARQRGFDAIFVGLYHTLTDGEGNHVESDEVLGWTSANSPLPVFAYWDFTVGKGKAVGGLVNSGGPQGEAAADLVLDILAGQAPGSIYPVTPKEGQFLFSRFELDRWNITLPATLAGEGGTILYVE